MIRVADLITWFENWANPAWQEGWDNCGWQIEPGVLKQPAIVLVCLTPTLAVMQEAVTLQNNGIPINLIFAHHPLLFHPVKSLLTGEAITEMLRLAFTYQVGIYTAHTNFDQVQDGTADVLATLLKLEQVTPIVPTQAGIGYGRVGKLNSALTLQNLLAQIQTLLQPPNLIFSPTVDLQQIIYKVAVLGGSGAGFISAVVKTKAQVYLTSDCKFHQLQESRDRGLILVDAGHYATERPACAHLVSKFIDIGVDWVQLSQQDEDFRHFYTQNRH